MPSNGDVAQHITAGIPGAECRPGRRSAGRRLSVGALVLGAIGLSACGGGSAGAPSSGGGSGATPASGTAAAAAPVDTTKTVLNLALSQEPPNFDYIAGPSTAIKNVIGLNVIETLFERTDKGELEPLLAKSYKTGHQGRDYTFVLRNANFQDGTPMTSADVVYSMQQYRKGANASVSAPYKVVRSIDAVDDHTVHVRLSKPSNSFLGSLATEAGFVIKKGTAPDLKTKPMGTGPFRFTSWRQGVGLTLQRFDGYWGKAPALKTVNVRYVTDPNSILNQLRAGQVDAAVLTGDQLEGLAADPRFAIHRIRTSEKMYFALNAKDPAFKDSRVREALNRAIDPKAIVKGVLNGLGTPMCVLYSPGEPGFTPDCPYPYDPGRAKELLAAAGASHLTVRLKFIKDGAAFSAMSDIVASELKRVGVNVVRQPRDLPTYLKEVIGPTSINFQTTVISGPQGLDNWRCPGFFVGYCDKKMDELLDQAEATTDQAQYANLRQQAALQYAKDGFVRVLTSGDQAMATAKAVVGIRPTIIPLAELDLRGVYWSKATS
ncbi:MAG: peptide/nickel transport system substrate-binding protein [Solirubrobacteraceae bacterium]